MKHSNLPFLVGVATLTLGGALGSDAQAQALPDLVINREDSIVRSPGGCEVSDELAIGRIAVKNVGQAPAQADTIREGLTMNWLAVYNPHNPDMRDDASLGESLEPFDQKGIPFDVGKGVLKRGRNYRNPPRNTQVGGGVSFRDETRAIQQALEKLGFDTGGVDGVMGRRTEAAIRAYQRSEGLGESGVLTDDQKEKLYAEANVPVTIVGGAQGVTQVTVYAVVDPENRIRESNEANNIEQWTVVIDCSN